MTTTTVERFVWTFGGPLAALPPWLAWSILAALGIGGAVWIVHGYRRTLVLLTPSRRGALTALRLLLWLLLVTALAGPARVQRTYAQKETRPLAVVIDRSDSMTAADNRGARRADDSQRRWRAFAPTARRVFGEPRSFAFADDFTSLSSPDADARLRTDRTRVFGALQRTLAEAPPGGWGGIVVLTDGLDTSGDDATHALDDTVRAALAAGTPIFPLPGRNRFAGGEFLRLRELTVPPRVPPRSKFLVELTLETFQPTARTVPLRLRVGEEWRPPATLALAAGRRALTWSAEIAADSPGLLPLELVVGEGDAIVTARSEVRIAPPETTRILYYQGALDWGYRFLADILRRDPAFSLTPIFNLAPASAGRARAVPAGALPDLPATAAGLDAYDIVVLANASASQFSEAQQAALAAWVRGGGILLFLAPDDDATRGYAGTELERLLPVVFTGERLQNTADDATTAFRRQIRQFSWGADQDTEVAFARGARRASKIPALATFAWEPAAGGILGADTVTAAPLFARYARVAGAKPGAIILARHPREKAADGLGAILLALQRYGAGRSAVLGTDALWRWKLNQPSTERNAELFWQNLLAWLAQERPRGPRFEHAPPTAEAGRELTLHVRGSRNPRLTARLEGAIADVPLPAAGTEGGSRLHRWTPAAPGLWLLTATDDDERTAHQWILVSEAVPAGEMSGQPPDDSLLQELARRTGGAVLETAAPAAWRTANSDANSEIRHERRGLLWHHPALLAGILGLYASELLLRRRWRLL